MTPMPASPMSTQQPNVNPWTPSRAAQDWLLTDAFYNGRLSVREYNTRLRELWQE